MKHIHQSAIFGRSSLSLLLCLNLASAAWGETPAPPDPKLEGRLLRGTHQLTFDGLRSGEGYFSPDGSRMIFQSERTPGNPFYQMYLMDLLSGQERRLSPGVGKTTCGWVYPDGKHVLFASTHADPQSKTLQQQELEARAKGPQRRYAWDFDEHYDIYRGGSEGGDLVNLTHTRGYDAEACVSPDGRYIVFASDRHAYSEPMGEEEAKLYKHDPSSQVDLYLMNADGSSVRRLTRAPGYDGGPFFSADGKHICYRHFSLDGSKAEVCVIDLPSPEETKEPIPRQLTRLGCMSWAPYFHPSGDYLIFTTNRHGNSNFELYLVDAAGSHEPVRVTHTDSFDGLPVFSPDGRHLAWTSSRTSDKHAQIFMADWNDGAARQMLGLPARASQKAGATPKTLSISAELLRKDVETLASPRMEGRLTGTRGEKLATDWVSQNFRQMGLAPAGDKGGYLQSFPFAANRLRVQLGSQTRDFAVERDWRPLAFSHSGASQGAVVMAGYGIVAPATADQSAYDSYANLDVKDKWVLVFRFLPENVSPARRQHLSHFSNLRNKAMQARDHGARGLLIVNGPNAQVKEPLVPMQGDAGIGGSSIPALSLRDEVGQALLGSARTLKQVQDKLDGGEAVAGFATEANLSAVVDVVTQKRTGHNVVARLRSPFPDRPALLVGAHVDHLGHGLGGTSLARGAEHGKVHLGADDNASGVASMLELARSLSERAKRGEWKPQRDILFVAWSGEELGLLGSSYFTHHQPPALLACLNMDMVGRLGRSLILQGYGSSDNWPGLVEKANLPVGLAIVPENESYLPTDATSFYLMGVPILNAFTGAHSDYHRPSDQASLLNYEGMRQVTILMTRIAESLAGSSGKLSFRRMEKPHSSQSRSGLRVYLGTIPDYAQGDTLGLKVSAVSAKGPPEAAGIQSGDVIVELAGKKIENIHDYTYALEGLKVGTPVTVVVLRQGKRLTLTITPGSRD